MTGPDPAATLARTILAAHEHRRQIAPPSSWMPGFDLPAAYRVAGEVRRLREARGERPVGRKIGFTNTTIWGEYGVDGPIWGTVYDTTLIEGAPLPAPLSLAAFVEPRIEPEIILGLGRAPEAGMDRRALFGCVAWVSLGFEIVQSLFAGWRFAAPDTVAAFGLHGCLMPGARIPVAPGREEEWLARLSGLTLTLTCDGEVADLGAAANVLRGGPLAALDHLVTMLANNPGEAALAPGEVISTGTLTRALPISPGQTWEAVPDDATFPALSLTAT
ncbi:2-keto-4-pentenoate hydratase [Methylobacterium sp. J-076]|uniref:2-keto-4-pentenoate hydratase n=1 Tax=Methylobacterium sp. J-076 TaxID=2836655 RepID=UPI001FB9E3C0|nr:hydratase [Methylobacterium sp. J-076]MCJ2012845.1 hydratase [Methylobacterium sp. J-076]